MTIKLKIAKNESLKCCFCETRIIKGKPYYDGGNGKKGMIYCESCSSLNESSKETSDFIEELQTFYLLERMNKMAPILDELDRRAS